MSRGELSHMFVSGMWAFAFIFLLKTFLYRFPIKGLTNMAAVV